MDNEPVLFEVTDKAVERANEYLPKVNRDDFEDEEDYIDEEVRNMADRFIYISAYHQAEKDTTERACQLLYDYNKQMVEIFGAKAVLSCNQFTIDVERFRKTLINEEE